MDGSAAERALEAAVAGDEMAFAAVYRDTQPRLLRFLRAQVGKDAPDVAAETWLAVVRDLDRFRGDLGGFRAWVLTVGRHRAIDAHRRRARRPVVLAADPAPTLAAPDDTAADALAGLGTRAALALIATLPPDQAEAVLLRAVVGLDVPRTARVLGKREGAVRVASHRGLKRLAAQLAEVERAAVGVPE